MALLATLFGLVSLLDGVLAAEQCGWNPGSPPLLHRGNICRLPIDDRVGLDPKSWGPWTHRPYCANSSYCSFTNARAARNRGMTLVATPETASSFLLEHPFHAPFPDPAKIVDPPPYEMREVKGKGMGLIATRRIEKNRVIVVDPAIILTPAKLGSEVTLKQKRDLLLRGAYRLADPGALLSLDKKGTPGISVVEDVIGINAFGVMIDNTSFAGVFPEVARLNHACSPNAFNHFSERTLAMTIWSSSVIEPGEEITISYSDIEHTHVERQDLLRNVWGFKCKCSLCTGSREAIKASDERRKRIRSLKDEVVDVALGGDYKRAIELSEELLAVIEEEGLTAHYGDFYEIPAQLYYATGDMKKAAKYAKLALEDLTSYGTPGEAGQKKIRMLTGMLMQISQLPIRRTGYNTD